MAWGPQGKFLCPIHGIIDAEYVSQEWDESYNGEEEWCYPVGPAYCDLCLNHDQEVEQIEEEV